MGVAFAAGPAPGAGVRGTSATEISSGLGIDAAGMGVVVVSEPKTAVKRSTRRSARAALAVHFSFAMPTRARRASSVTSRTPRDTTGTSMRMEHRMEQTVRLSLAVTPLSR